MNSQNDSPGYSTNYDIFSLMNFATDLILHYSLVQVTETGSSIAMAKEGLRDCINKVFVQGVKLLP